MIKQSQLENPNSIGTLIFAFNGDLDYVSIAAANARLIKKNLNIPVTLVTDSPVDDPIFDQVKIIKNHSTNKRTFRWNSGVEMINWKNSGRHSAYELSPYSTTILLDADYFVFTDKLKQILNSDIEITAFDSVYDVSGKNSFAMDQYINFNSLQMYWATVIVFKKSNFVKQVFEFWKQVEENWNHYRVLYNFKSATYRNDFAFTIALNTLQGHINSFCSIPYALPTLNSSHTVDKITKDGTIFLSYPDHKAGKVVKKQTLYCGDLHVMNKSNLSKIYEFTKICTI